MTWGNVNNALILGSRGLPGGSCLKRLLVARRATGPEPRAWRPALTLEQIWKWAQAFHDRHGDWPASTSGPIAGSTGDTWATVQGALARGCRGLPRSSLVRLLASHGVRAPTKIARVTERQILAWAKAHRKKTGQWPRASSGRIPSAKGLTWSTVDAALRQGYRGLPGGSSLGRLLGRKKDSDRGPAPPMTTDN
jgi:hypothetical protein